MNVKKLFTATVKAWWKDNPSVLAAALAYYAFFSLVPVFIIVASFGSALFGSSALDGGLSAQLSPLVGERGAAALQSTLAYTYTLRSDAKTMLFGTLLLLLSAATVFMQMGRIMDIIWSTRKKKKLKVLVERRLASILLLPGFTAIFLLVWPLTALLSAIGFSLDRALYGPFVFLAPLMVLFVLSFALFAMMYKILPPVKLHWRDVYLGAFVTALLFTLGEYILAWFLGHNQLTTLYGALGTVAIFLVWLYFSAHLFIFGAEFTKVYASMEGSHKER
jgi:membrane protein